MKSKFFKLGIACLLCIGTVYLLVTLIQYFAG